MIVFQIVTICHLSLPSRSSQCPWIGILAEYETSMFLHKVPQYLSLIFYKVLQFLRYLLLLINNIGPKVLFFSPVIFSIIYNMNHYHAATFSLTSNNLTSFNANSKCLEKQDWKTAWNIVPNTRIHETVPKIVSQIVPKRVNRIVQIVHKMSRKCFLNYP